jgi:hypothetical protein
VQLYPQPSGIWLASRHRSVLTLRWVYDPSTDRGGVLALSKVNIAVARMALSIGGMFAGTVIAYYIVRVTTDAGFRVGALAGAAIGFLIGAIAFPVRKS